ncbi:phospholipase D-like domain-containing protein [uncultured Delftia sp.]|uniref:phospholipase D-like domain-containing protein n=1 Tax=uncultured Delftia sp. TaxID=191464 RepID=UPI002591BE37|nr:phospholipase D-like domain-containing protein [uncultured Delftia sp.]
MKTVKVFLPVLRGRISFIVDRGRHWSVVEHLLLDALTRKEWSTSTLAEHGKLPRRVVIEALVRLMRAGWVELSVEKGDVNFRATEIGKVAAEHHELPRLSDLQKRPTNYILDMVCGEIFRNRDLLAQSEEEIKRIHDPRNCVWIEPRDWHTEVEVNEALQVLLDNDETFVSGQPGGIFRRWVMVLVRGGRIVSGLPENRTLDKLRTVVLQAAGDAEDEGTVHVTPTDEHELERVQLPQATVWDIGFSLHDLILGGAAHRKILLHMLENAKTHVYIHSTFISDERVLDLLPNIRDAIDRGVHIHIFWGQNEVFEELATTRIAIGNLRKNHKIQALAEHITFHPYSTGSHAKLLLADAGTNGEYVAVVGSCNWLTSGFDSYEASVVLRDPKMVDEVVRCFGRLVCMHDGLWSELAGDIVRISGSLKKATSLKVTGQGSILCGGQHNDLVLRARDEACQSILLVSHRLGVAAGPGILAPLQSAAATTPQLAVEIYYCRKTAPVRKQDERRLTDVALDSGVILTPIQSPRVHAKILVWDEDNAVITSLNWLSADQTQSSSLSEIGVHLRVEGIGRYISEHLRAEIQLAEVARA